MKRFPIIARVASLVLGALVLALPAGAVDHPELDYETVIVRAFFDDPVMVRELAAEVEPWDVDYNKGFVVLEVSQFDRERLEERGFRVVEDTAWTTRYHQAMERVRQGAGEAQRGGFGTIPGFACYRSVQGTYDTATSLVSSYPQLTSWIDIGDSWEKTQGLGGHDLFVLKITNSAVGGTKPKLFVMSSVHAREYTPAETNTRFAEYLLHNYGTDPDATWLVDHHEVHLLLQANPDGRVKAQTGLSWRKNTDQNYCSPTSNSRGADLNRNYPFNWGCCGGSSGSQCSETYRGPSPTSEPETQAVVNYVRSIFPDQRADAINQPAPDDATGVFLDVHSYSQLVLWPWGFSNVLAGNSTQLQTLGRKLAWFNDYEPEQAISLYPTDGTTDDFAYGELGLAAYTFELGTSFFQSCSAFESTILPDNLNAMIYAAKVSRTPYMTPAGPDIINLALSAGAIAPGGSLALTATASDTRFSANNGNEPTQDIAAAEAYFDIPPWAAGATAMPMAAQDGNFNTSVESVTAALDTSGLANGQHTLFVRARDDAGNWGAVSAAFVFVIDPATAPKIAGNVTAAGSGEPLAATVAAGPLFQTVNNAGDGSFELLLVAGTYDVTVTPDSADYGARTVAGLSVQNGQTLQQNFVLYPLCEVFSDDVESGVNGWSAQAPWAITTETSNSATHSWTDSPGGNYSDNRDISLTSPVINLTGISDVRLDFAHICDTEATYDFCIVEVSPDGNTWSQIETYDGSSSSWQSVSLAVPVLDNAAQARVRFRFTSDVTVRDDGWHLDDIAVRGAGAMCVTSDADGDDVSDGVDNCTLVANPDQRDTNGDGFGNLCDPDLDGNGAVNFLDLAVMKAAFFTSGDTDTDLDGDALTNFVDLGIMKAYFFGAPGPSAATQ